jgi:selenocysteine lyase/cysteine desulfurase
MVFHKDYYNNEIPDIPGGGTVSWTNPWGGRKYFDEVEVREAGGTPPFMQTIKAALSVKLKEKMGVANIIEREHEILDLLFAKIDDLPNLHILADNIKDRMGVISFYIDNLHFNLGVKILNDRFGIQMRGGCSCAGTYGHILLSIPETVSNKITDEINHGKFSNKPGWIRCSIHPTMSNDEVNFIADSMVELAANHVDWSADYEYDKGTNEFVHKDGEPSISDKVDSIYKSI